MSAQVWKGKLPRLPKIHVRGIFFRMVRAEDAHALLSTGSSFTYGGRYNKPGEFGALYLSEDPRFCEREKTRQAGDNPRCLPAQIVGSVEVDVGDVLDLTDDRTVQALGVSARDLVDLVDVTVPRDLADVAREAGVRALLVPSAVAAGRNLVIFEDSLTAPLGPARLVRKRPWAAS